MQDASHKAQQAGWQARQPTGQMVRLLSEGNVQQPAVFTGRE